MTTLFKREREDCGIIYFKRRDALFKKRETEIEKKVRK